MTHRTGSPRRLPPLAAFLAAPLAALLAACSDAPLQPREPGAPGAPGRVAAVAVAPGDLALDVGATATLSATPLDPAGTPLPGRPVAWTSSDTLVATVSPAGLVSARRAGAATIRASSDGRSGGVSIVVGERAVAWIVVTPSGGMIPQELGTSRQLGVVARAADGTEIAGRPVAWSSSDATVATVSATGLLVAHGPGTATVVAVVDGRRDSTTVWVRSLVAQVHLDPTELALGVGEVRTIAASARDENAAPLARTFAWSSSNSAVATVDAAGRVTARGAGTALVTATTEGRSATTRVTVTGRQLGLRDVAGGPLPEILEVATTVVDGVVREARVQVTGGHLRLNDGRYELRLDGWLLVDGAAPVPTVVRSEGVVAYHALTGAPLFFEREDWWNAEPRFRGRIREDGTLELGWSRAPGAPVVALGFAP